MEHYYLGESEEEDASCANFDCNICLESVRDPVVTFCGHLFCWPCIYKWTHMRSSSSQEDQRCPVCKAEVSQKTLIPIYGGGQTSKNENKKCSQPRIVVPRRPLGPIDGPDGQTSRMNPRLEPEVGLLNRQMRWMPDPVTGVVCEMLHERLFGNSMAGAGAAPRWVMEANKHLRRIYCFLLCCMLLCLLLF